MKILKRDDRAGSLKILVEIIDDLWHLRNIIRKGDLASAMTYRRDEKKTDKIRAEKVEKKRMYLTLEVEEVEFHDFSDRLRIHGTIKEGPQDLGSYHTLNIEVGSDLKVQKELWNVSDQQLLKDAVGSTKRPLVTLVGIEEGEATIAILRHYGIKEVASISFRTPGKQYKTKVSRKEFFSEVVDTLSATYNGEAPLIIVGPGFTKDDLYHYGMDTKKDLFKDCHLIATGQAGIVGIREAIKSTSTVKVLEQTRVAEETQMVERLFEEISKNGPCEYGIKEVLSKIKTGAVELLLVTDDIVREGVAESLMVLARDLGSEIHIISTAHESGRRLQRLGGVAALLRY